MITVIIILTHIEYFQLHGPILSIFHIFSLNFTTLCGSYYYYYFFFFSQSENQACDCLVIQQSGIVQCWAQDWNVGSMALDSSC